MLHMFPTAYRNIVLCNCMRGGRVTRVAVWALCVVRLRCRLERVSDEELKGSGPPAMQRKVALGPDCGFGVRPATVRPSEMESMEDPSTALAERVMNNEG